MGEVTIFVEGAGKTPARPCPTNPVYDSTRPTPLVRRHVRDVPQRAYLVSHPPTSHSCALRLGQPTPAPPPYPGPGVPTTEGRSSGKCARAPSCSSSSSRPEGIRSGSWGSAPPTSTGHCPCPVPPSRRPRHGTGCTPSCEHRRSPTLRGSTLCCAPRHHLMTPGGPGP